MHDVTCIYIEQLKKLCELDFDADVDEYLQNLFLFSFLKLLPISLLKVLLNYNTIQFNSCYVQVYYIYT